MGFFLTDIFSGLFGGGGSGDATSQKALSGLMGSFAAPVAPPPPPDATDEAVRNARIFERRRQLGLQGRLSTFLTTSQGDYSPSQSSAPTNTLLGS